VGAVKQEIEKPGNRELENETRYHLFINPIAVGGGTSYLPRDIRVELELVDERRFRSGVVFLRYRPR
jgi:dihydrofolate reductase